ncbi:Gamma-glutamylcyclotransferase [Bertholletia excelsa]
MSHRDEAQHNPPNLIFTYGTLKRGFANHGLLQSLFSTNDAAFLGTYRTAEELPLVCGPHGVPFLLNFPGSGLGRHRVRGELYAVSDHGLTRLDELEGISVGHYERLPIRLLPDGDSSIGGGGGGATVVEAEAYYAHRSFAEDMWRRNGWLGFEVYTEEACKYVRRALRPKNRSFLEDIRLFVSSSS